MTLRSTALTPDGEFRRVAAFGIAEGFGAFPSPAIRTGRLSRDGHARGGVFIPLIRGNDNDTAAYRLWIVRAVGTTESSKSTQADRMLLGAGTVTASAETGQSGELVADTDRICDALTFTPAPAESRGTKLLAALTDASIGVVNPAGDGLGSGTPAMLIVPDLGAGHEVHFENQTASAAITARWLAGLHT